MSDRRVVAIVPVKGLEEAKSRLAAVLSPAARRRLVLEMLRDTLAALSASGVVDTTLVVSRDAAAARVAEAGGARVVREAGGEDLNGALRKGLEVARAHGAGRALILPADLPYVTADDIRAVVAEPEGAAGVARPVVIVPSHDRLGTNALLMALAAPLAPGFGADSFRRHLEQAAERGLEVEVRPIAGLGLDVDQPSDLERLARQPSYHWLADELRSAACGDASQIRTLAISEAQAS